jgi:anti-sigma factor ChrR (cupin superfamily)
MITDAQKDQASLYALGALTTEEQGTFENELRTNSELRELALSLQRSAMAIAGSVARHNPPASLKTRIFDSIEQAQPKVQSSAIPAGFRFLEAGSQSGWKELPITGAWIKLLSLEKDRGYAVLLGKLDPGVGYPAHINAGPEDFYVLSGDLVVGERRLVAGDFHHADKGSFHDINYSPEGCTLLAVLTIDDPLVAFAMA